MTDLLFADFETLGPDITMCGSMRYVTNPDTGILMLSYAFNNDPAQLWFPGEPLPEAIRTHVENGGYVVAWKASFDRLIWQFVGENDYDFPQLHNDQVLCAMAQAQGSNLPEALDGAAKVIGKTLKHADGKRLIRMFCTLGANALPEDYPEEWERFKAYALDDVNAMKDVWYACRPLSFEEWQEYWASERINDRGFGIDVDMCERCARFYEIDKQLISEDITRLSNGVITSPNQSQRINHYFYERLPAELSKIMVKERDDDGNPTKFSMRKDVIHMLIEDIHASDIPVDDRLVELLELLEFGRSSSALKYQKAYNQHVNGRLHDSYVFNGAAQTGRYSSRGLQVHNLVRTRLSVREPDGSKRVVEGEVYELIVSAV